MTNYNLNDPATYKPKLDNSNINTVITQAICTGWLKKHRAPTFSFMKNTKERFIVLVDRMLYSFKSDKPDTYKEFFEITKDTHVFATDKFQGELYCIEIRKIGLFDDNNSSWYLQAGDASTMKVWLNSLKLIVNLLKQQHEYFQENVITKDILVRFEQHVSTNSNNNSDVVSIHSTNTVEDENLVYYHHLNKSNSSHQYYYHNLPSPPIINHQQELESVYSYPTSLSSTSIKDYSIDDRKKSISKRSNASAQHMPILLPPQLPPPKSQPPPVPSYAYF